MGCCSCFGFMKKPKRSLKPSSISDAGLSEELLFNDNLDDEDIASNSDESTDILCTELHFQSTSFEDSFFIQNQNGMLCREVPVKETRLLIRAEDDNGNKMVNEYVRKCKIGSGSYGKVVLYRSINDGDLYAIKAFHKSHLLKVRVAPSETAMNDVLREVSIMKKVDHPNIVNLVEVIDDPSTDHFYMVLEYIEGKRICDSASNQLGEAVARKYLRDIIAGLMYLHAHNIVHGDIKPDNLLITTMDTVKILDFSVSQIFVDDNDELQRSPGTPVFTAPECCLGSKYHGKAADTWALGITLYRMVVGQYPFMGDTLPETYDKIVNNPLLIPEDISPQLKNLLEGILCKDPKLRLSPSAVAEHPWIVEDLGPIPQHLCICKCRELQEGMAIV